MSTNVNVHCLGDSESLRAEVLWHGSKRLFLTNVVQNVFLEMHFFMHLFQIEQLIKSLSTSLQKKWLGRRFTSLFCMRFSPIWPLKKWSSNVEEPANIGTRPPETNSSGENCSPGISKSKPRSWGEKQLITLNYPSLRRSMDEDWLAEYRRLHFLTPNVESQTVQAHNDEVLHVCFSNDGRVISTCSKVSKQSEQAIISLNLGWQNVDLGHWWTLWADVLQELSGYASLPLETHLGQSVFLGRLQIDGGWSDLGHRRGNRSLQSN